MPRPYGAWARWDPKTITARCLRCDKTWETTSHKSHEAATVYAKYHTQTTGHPTAAERIERITYTAYERDGEVRLRHAP